MVDFSHLVEAAVKPVKEDEYTGVKDFPFNRQTYDYDCGACALQSVLFYFGYNVREEKIMDAAKTNEKYGTSPEGMAAVLKKYKIAHKAKLNMSIEDLKKELAAGNPVIVLLQAWGKNLTGWDNGHWVVAIGFKDETVFFEDPSCDTRAFMTFEELDKRWHDKISEKTKYEHYGIVVSGRKAFDPEMAKHMD